MGRIMTIIRHEALVTLRKRSFWFLTFVLPLIIMAATVASQFLIGQDMAADIGFPPTPANDATPIGIIDRSGIVQDVPAALPQGLVLLFADEAEARAAFDRGDVASYYLVHADYVASGRVDRVEQPFNPLALTNRDLLRFVLSANLLQDEQLAGLVLDPSRAARQPDAQQRLSPEPLDPAEVAGPLAGLVPYAVLFIMFFIITTGGEYVSESVANEKENRTAEVLLVTLTPRDLMLGKVLAMGLISLFQVAVWIVVGILILSPDWGPLAVVGVGDLGLSFMVYAVLYMLLGYMVYASALAVVGALSPGVREVGQWQWLIMAPLFLTLFLNFVLIQQPQSVVSVVLSLFPLTSPLAMLTRMAASTVPTIQAVVGLLLLAGMAYLNVLLAARSFRADTLLSGEGISARRLFRQLRRSS
jgi:ABC-2 type transport system permease protein